MKSKFVQGFDYVLQMWVFRENIFQNTGCYYDPYIVAVTKESHQIKQFYTAILDVLTLKRNISELCYWAS
ncbi:PD-(D/E)XK nuclease-like domain-containing protein [Lysinibacillus xylanilyticus]|uniref:PD-(D/E)XK nuclease-like domain-containing protein n=1 Tax=Lysinibacillus xylanilyticus TaxID=582475 RepID=UPI00380D2FE7